MEVLGSRPLAAVLVLALVPWTLGAAQEAPEAHITDPAGDALWYRSTDLAGLGANAACSSGGQVTARACESAPVSPYAAAPGVGGAQAPGALDITHVRFVDDGTTLVVEMGLASISNELVTFGAPVNEGLGWNVIWRTAEGEVLGGAGLGLYRIDGSHQFDNYWWRTDGSCAKTTSCWFYADFEIVPGSPGAIRWTIPRVAMPAPLTLLEPNAETWHYVQTPGDLSPTYGLAAQDARAGGGVFAYPSSMVDFAGPGDAVVLAPPALTWRADLPWDATTPDPVGDLPTGRPDLDIINVTIVETERTLTMAVQALDVGEIPADHHFLVELYVTTGASVTAGYTAREGVRTPFSGVCDGACAPNPRTPLSKPADVAVEPGTPGWINVTFSRADLGLPTRGDTLGGLYIGLLLPQAVVQQDAPAAEARVQQKSIYLGDFVWEQRPWWFSLGPEPIVETDDRAVIVEDPVGDIDLGLNDPTTAMANLDAFDIVSLRAEGSDVREARIELGIADLSNIAPPTGYSAVFYAAAVSTERGTFMAGYYADDAKKQFFCAPDTAVLTKPESDPNDVVWQAIDGLLSIARDRGAQAGGGSSPGSIVFLVPYSCFDEPGEGDLTVDSLAAATFIMRAGSILRLDEAQSEGAVTIQAIEVPVVPWYVENWLDVLGIVVAVLLALVGAIAIRRRRGALRRYLHEIERVLKENHGDARAREKALVAVQLRVREDLLRNRITESHFVIVEKRLDEQLSKVRVQALGDAFGDLPHRLLVTLQDLLRDGTMDVEDWRLFRSQLAAEQHLNGDSRAAIERRVEAWVRQEQAIAPPS